MGILLQFKEQHMKTKFLFILLLLPFLLGGCELLSAGDVRGFGDVIQEERSLKNVSGVELGAPGEMDIRLGDTESLVIEAEENLLQYIETSLEGGILKVYARIGANLEPTKPIIYTLTVKRLLSLEVTSNGSITAPALEADRFRLEVNSSGHILLAGITVRKLEVLVNSSGYVEIGTGEVTEQEIVISSSGNYSAPDVRSQKATATLDSSGNATVWVSEQLDAEMTSSGNVYYYGQAVVNETSSSSGAVISKGNK
jgi:hypothetical protein